MRMRKGIIPVLLAGVLVSGLVGISSGNASAATSLDPVHVLPPNCLEFLQTGNRIPLDLRASDLSWDGWPYNGSTTETPQVTLYLYYISGNRWTYIKTPTVNVGVNGVFDRNHQTVSDPLFSFFGSLSFLTASQLNYDTTWAPLVTPGVQYQEWVYVYYNGVGTWGHPWNSTC